MNKLSRFLPFFLIIILSILLTGRLLRPGYFSMQDDMHLFRLSEFDLCLKSGQIPCRYSPNSALGFGSAVFNFYPPFSYALAQIYHLLGFSLINSLKIVYLIPLFVGPVFMFLLSKHFFGVKGGLLSAFLFALAPYQATNLYVRGALAENLALNLIPLILYLFIKSKTKLTIFFLCLLLLTHQLTSLYCLLFLFLLSLYLKRLPEFIKNLLWSILLSAFFLLPSMLEKSLTTNTSMTQGYFSYINHFATLRQLFIDRFWGYGASLWGPKDDMAFQVGFFQWLLPLFSFVYLLFNKSKSKFFTLSLFVLSLFFLFLTHNKSTFIWKLFPFMAYFQFPWRFIGAATITLCLMSAYIFHIVPKKLHLLFLTFILISTFLLNFSFFKEDIWYPNLTDNDKLTGPSLIAQQGASLKDFYPKYSLSFPTSISPLFPIIVDGQVTKSQLQKNSLYSSGFVDVSSPQATINLPIAYFPKMELRLDGQKSSYRIDPLLGLVQFDVSSGIHYFYLRFHDTPLRTISNIISLLALFLFIIKIIREQK